MAEPNPNPALITDPMWRLWTDCPVPARLSGIYADKPGYHNTVNKNEKAWPDNYSIQLPLDLPPFNQTKARAIDLTMTDAEMVRWTNRMRLSALDPDDLRLAAVREFYGTLDNKTVYGLIKNGTMGPWRKSSANKTHLWHGHTSVFTMYVNNWTMLAPIISVWSGQTNEEWVGGMFLPKYGESGEEVKFWQYMHNNCRTEVTPPSPAVVVDGDYGDATAAAFADFWRKAGGQGNFDGKKITGWLGIKYHAYFARKFAPEAPVGPTDEQLQMMVNTWLKENIPSQLSVSGILNGEVKL